MSRVPWLDAVRRYIASGDEDMLIAANVVVHDMIDEMLHASEWMKCDVVIGSIRPKRDSIHLILSVLVSTVNAANMLVMRKGLYDSVYERTRKYVSIDYLNGLQGG